MLYLYLSLVYIYIYKFYPWSVAIEIPLLFRGLVVPRSVVGRPSFNKRICHKGPWQHDPYGMAIWFENPKPLVTAPYGKEVYPSWKHIISWSNNRFSRIFFNVYLTVNPARNSYVDVHHVWYEPTNLNPDLCFKSWVNSSNEKQSNMQGVRVSGCWGPPLGEVWHRGHGLHKSCTSPWIFREKMTRSFGDPRCITACRAIPFFHGLLNRMRLHISVGLSRFHVQHRIKGLFFYPSLLIILKLQTLNHAVLIIYIHNTISSLLINNQQVSTSILTVNHHEPLHAQWKTDGHCNWKPCSWYLSC